MSKRRVSFGGVSFAPDGKSDLPAPSSQKSAAEAEKPAKMRKNNKIIENSEFNFGTADQRAENQQYINEKVRKKIILGGPGLFASKFCSIGKHSSFS